MIRTVFLIFMALLSLNASAHKPSDSYLMLKIQAGQLHGQWDIALRDLDYALGLDANDDGKILWAELHEHQRAIYAYALNRLSIKSQQQDCTLQPADMLVDEHSDGHYAVLNFQVVCPAPAEQLSITYNLFFDIDLQHRGLFSLIGDPVSASGIFSPEQQNQSFALEQADKPWQELKNFAYEGVWHIWIGFDHILFLLSLILPAALHRDSSGWQPKLGFMRIFADVLEVVTAFTLAHSITLSLTALHYIALPSRWVESAIAASVIVAALNNIYPLILKRRTWLAFGFGLVHGMGIASVLLDMGVAEGQRLWSLFGFNLGVEIGQLAIVVAVLPLIALFSRNRLYPLVVMKLGSVGIVGIAGVWLLERSLDVQLIGL